MALECSDHADTTDELDRLRRETAEGEARIRRLVEGSPVGVVRWVMDGSIIDANTCFLDMAGLSREDLQAGRIHWADVTPADLRPHGQDAIAGPCTTGDGGFCEAVCLRKDGSSIPVAASSVVISEKPWEAVTFIQDLTPQQRLEEALRKSETDLARVQAMAHMGSWTWDLLNDVVTWSQETYNIYGVDKETFGHTVDAVAKLIHPDDLWLQQQAIESARQGRTFQPFEYRVPRSDGTTRIVQVQSAEVERDAAGRPVRVYGIVVDVTERRQVERELRQSEERIRYIIKHNPNAIAVFDKDLRYILVSDRFLRDYNVGEQDIIGKRHYEVFPEMPQRWRDVHQRCLAGTIESNDDDSFVRPDGSITYTRWECRPWYDAHGQVGGMIAYTEVTTERKQAENALRASQERLQLAQQIGRIGTFDWDLRTNAATWTPELEALYGLPPGSFGGQYRNWEERVHPADLRHIAQTLQEAIRTASGAEMEFRIIWPDGTVRWIACWARVFSDDGGNPVRMVGVNMDITDPKQNEEQLRQSEERLRLAAEIAGIGYWDWDVQTNALSWSPRAKALFGLPLDAEMTFERFLQCLDPDYQDYMRRRTEESLHAREDMETEVRVVWPDGSVHWVLGYSRMLYDTQDHPMRLTGVAMDITQRKEAEMQLKVTNEILEQRVAARTAEAEHRASQLRMLVSELTQTEQRERRRLAQILHDHLQQLLVGAKFSIGALRGRVEDRHVRHSLQQVDELIDQSIQASRSLTIELNPPILYQDDFPAILQWLADRAQQTHGLHVALHVEGPVRSIGEGTRILLFQAVRELLFNVAKHAQVSQADMRVDLSDNDQICIEVSDAGVGFDPATRRADTATTTGLGLFSIRERLELAGGHMTVDSAPGQGTRVTLLAPMRLGDQLSRAQEAAVEQLEQGRLVTALRPPPAAMTGRGDKIRVLLADDHKILREGVAELLLLEPDIEVVGEASDGRMAVELARSMLPDVVIMDVSMPGMDGVEATRIVRAELPQIQVIGLSMHEQGEMAATMRAAGAAAYLTKGGPSETLVAAIRCCAGKSIACQ